MRAPKPFVPQSFSEIQSQRSRALSTFVAIAHAQAPVHQPMALPIASAILGGAAVLIGLGVPGPSRVMWLAGGGCALAVAIFGLWAQGNGALTFGSERVRREAGRARLLMQLDRKRRSVGLDSILMPEQLAALETAARIWEKIGHTLDSATWREQPVLDARVEHAASESMLRVLALNLGSLVAEGVTTEEAPERAQAAFSRLQQISIALDVASNALESYQRPDETTAGADPGLGFPEIEALEELLDT